MPADEVVQTPFGKFLVNDHDLIESTIKAGTVWDGPGFLQVIGRQYALSPPGVTVLDVGAHVGDWTIWLAQQGVQHVVAVEAVPATILRLKANLDLNKEVCADRVTIIPYAAYDRYKALEIADVYDDSNTGGTRLREKTGGSIKGVPLDDYRALFGWRVGLIKIDVQGAEEEVLAGLRKTIQKDHPAIVYESESDDARQRCQRFFMQCAPEYVIQQWPTHPDNYLAVPISR